MQRNTKLVWPVVCALIMVACSGTPQTMLSPSGAAATDAALNADGSSLKITAPRDLGPNGGTVNTLRPTLTFTNATGRFVSVGLAYDLEVQNAAGGIVYARTIGETPTSGSHTLEADLNYSENYWFRLRGRLSTQFGPWSDFAQFRTFDRPGPAPPSPTAPGASGGLPFAIPASCLAGNGASCAFEVAGLSAEWGACRAGDGIGCHRYVRQVIYALSRTDPNWKMIQAAPGGNACNCNACGPSDGTMFREDTTVYGGNQVFDLIVGAGGPAPGLAFNLVPGPRPGDIPADAPLCR
jgi:hypothetical protein